MPARQVALALVGVAVFGLLIRLVLTGPPSGTPSSPYPSLDPEVAYTGDEACAACHFAIQETFAHTGMGRSFYRPTADNVIEDYDHDNHVFDPRSNLHYEMLRKGDRFYQREYRLDEDGALVHELTRVADFIIGSGNHNRTYVTRDNGYLLQMPVTWYSEKGVWDLSPGYRENNTRFSRPIVEQCMNCHNSYAEFELESESRYLEPLPTGIGCERCHGPGSLHVAWRGSAASASAVEGAPDSTIINPRRLPHDLQMDVCLQCHLMGSVRMPREGFGESAFRPGMRLGDVRAVFVERNPRDEFGVTSHGERLVQSTCYKRSAGRLACITCHDPHRPVQSLSREFFNTRCAECHATDDLQARVKDTTIHRSGADCVSCHMPQGETEDVQHVNFTDHWIRRPGEQVTTAGSSPETLVEFESFFPASDPAARLRLGMAYVHFYETRARHTGYLKRALPLLEDGVRDLPGHTTGRYFLALARTHLGNLEEAARQYEELLERSPAQPLASFQLGKLRQRQGALDDARRAYEHTIELAPAMVKAHNNLGNVVDELGTPEAALPIYERAIELMPGYATAHYNLGHVLLYRMGEVDRALPPLEKAVALDPDLVQASHALAVARLETGNESEAFDLLHRVLASDPGFVPAYGTLALIHRARGEHAQAVEMLERLLELAPGDVLALELHEQIEMQADREGAAGDDVNGPGDRRGTRQE